MARGVVAIVVVLGSQYVQENLQSTFRVEHDGLLLCGLIGVEVFNQLANLIM